MKPIYKIQICSLYTYTKYGTENLGRRGGGFPAEVQILLGVSLGLVD